VLIGLVVVAQRHARGDGGGFALSFIWIQLIAQRHGLVICLLRARTRPEQVAQHRMRVSVMVLVFEVASSPVLAGGWSSGCGSGAPCVAGQRIGGANRDQCHFGISHRPAQAGCVPRGMQPKPCRRMAGRLTRLDPKSISFWPGRSAAVTPTTSRPPAPRSQNPQNACR
jgi:hypothetical protein